ncbi:hypothetical protein [Arthrobacter sp. TWP1-1]|uniref:hypothetical protein n=1 Tax=Arthrobacter sp. TWP1-1 TaxID=2804568 RepID=UPI003CEDA930
MPEELVDAWHPLASHWLPMPTTLNLPVQLRAQAVLETVSPVGVERIAGVARIAQDTADG